jgi:hypothetical protein
MGTIFSRVEIFCDSYYCVCTPQDLGNKLKGINAQIS